MTRGQVWGPSNKRTLFSCPSPHSKLSVTSHMTFHLYIPFRYTLLPVSHSCFKSVSLLQRIFCKFECQSWHSLHVEFCTFKERCREIHAPLRKRKSFPRWFISVRRICHSEYVSSIQSKTRRYRGSDSHTSSRTFFLILSLSLSLPGSWREDKNF